jgi:Flp pilus assembly protein TadG
MMSLIKAFVSSWWSGRDGVAATEAALVFPILLTLLLGVFDFGNAILVNQKTIRASQVTADLIARNRSVDALIVADAVAAGRLAYEPLSSESYGVDVVSIRFDDNADPQIVWRETQGMSPMADVLADVQSMAEAGNGVLVVGVEYTFEPLFAGFIVDEILMQERAFARGRKGPVVTYD